MFIHNVLPFLCTSLSTTFNLVNIATDDLSLILFVTEIRHTFTYIDALRLNNRRRAEQFSSIIKIKVKSKLFQKSGS